MHPTSQYVITSYNKSINTAAEFEACIGACRGSNVWHTNRKRERSRQFNPLPTEKAERVRGGKQTSLI
jgi:hypothetical protein